MSMLDGNAVAGELSEIFALDVTTAIVTCADCGATGMVAAAHVFESEIGTVMRCPACEGVLARIVHMPGEIHMEMRGIRVLRLRV
jgi:hypothetical protein